MGAYGQPVLRKFFLGSGHLFGAEGEPGARLLLPLIGLESATAARWVMAGFCHHTDRVPFEDIPEHGVSRR